MDRRNSSRQVLIPLPSNLKPSILNQTPELLLARKPLDALDKVLIAVAIAGDELADEGDGAEGPLLVDCVEERVFIDLAEFETGEDTAWLEDTVGFSQCSGDVGEVADAECDGVEIQ